MEISFDWNIPVWGIVLILGTIVGAAIKLYYNLVWLEKKFKFWQQDYIVFKTDTQTDIEKCEEQIKEHGQFKGVDLTDLNSAVKELVKSNLQTQTIIQFLADDIKELKRNQNH